MHDGQDMLTGLCPSHGYRLPLIVIKILHGLLLVWLLPSWLMILQLTFFHFQLCACPICHILLYPQQIDSICICRCRTYHNLRLYCSKKEAKIGSRTRKSGTWQYLYESMILTDFLIHCSHEFHGGTL